MRDYFADAPGWKDCQPQSPPREHALTCSDATGARRETSSLGCDGAMVADEPQAESASAMMIYFTGISSFPIHHVREKYVKIKEPL